MDPSQRKSKIDDVHQKIRRVGEAAAELAKERVKLLEELNDVQPAISVLPPEIFCHIFYFAHPSRFDTLYGPERMRLFCGLQFVSKHWRKILLCNPVIWTEFDLCIAPVNVRRDARPLHAFITHSRQLPLSVGIKYFSIVGINDGAFIHPSVDPSLLKSLGRVSCIRLNNPPVAWFSHLALFKQTTHLVLSNVRITVPPLSLDQVASLCDVTVRESPGTRFTSTHAITTLNLDSMPISSSFHIFRNCPNLKNLYLSCHSHDRNSGFPVDSFTLPHLEELHWVHDEVMEDVLQIPPFDSHLESISFIDCSIPYFRCQP